MLYFIPAWYAKDAWKESEQLWHSRRTQTETDDTVKQIQLFRRNDVSQYEILLLSYAPNFRHFLHRQSMFRAPYWSVFDAMQEVRRKKQAILSFHDLNWPREIEFVYTPFSVIAMLKQEQYAQIGFGEYGNPIEVTMYREGQVIRKNLYDDRGFVSSTAMYERGELAYTQYLTDQGVWKLCHFADGHVAVNPRNRQYLIRREGEERQIAFRKETYASMEEVIEEVFGSYLQCAGSDAIFCAAAQGWHLPLLDRLLAGRKTVFSFFGNRLQLRGNEPAMRALSHGDCIVADSEDSLELLLQQEGLEAVAKVNIPPYDTRLEPGISQKLPVQNILFPVDSLEAGTFARAVGALAAYLERNQDARVHLFTRNAAFGREDALLGQVREILMREGYPPGWAREHSDNKAEFLLEAEEQLPVLFLVKQCVDELSVNKCVREQRILVDLADTPDLFLQISCVGMGIPQILKDRTQYMRPGKNGRINQDISKLGEDLAYYLEVLANWNQAMIQSHELGKHHTAQYLVERWKEVIGSIENSKGITVGKGRFQ